MSRIPYLIPLVLLVLSPLLQAEPHPLLTKFDEDKDGYLGREETPAMLQEHMDRMDTDGDGKLSSEELNKVPQRAVNRMVSGEATPSRAPRKPGEVVAPAAREEFDKQSLKIDDEVPDFTLQTYDQKSEITLSSFQGEKPVVLVFGSITCSPFRQRVLEVVPLFEQYQEKAQFLMVYIREAHPESVIQVPTPGGGMELRKFEQTDELLSRQESASYCTVLLDLPWPVLVDGEDNAVKEAYAGWPIRLMVIGKDGKLKFDGGQGPGGFQPSVLGEWLAENLE